MKIGNKDLSEGTFVIAEGGSNHDGSLETAKELIDVAADAGADAVKFQTFRADKMYDKKSNEFHLSEDDETAYDIFKSLEMPYDWIPKLKERCEERGIEFLSTPFDERSAEILDEYVSVFKVASSMMSHHPLLEHLAEYGKPMIMSTGAHTTEEIAESVSLLKESSVDDLVLLQCVNAYPAPLEDSNVNVVKGLHEEFGLPTGLSDHTTDPVTAPAAAVALGGVVVEKHFTLDNSMEGPDHDFALKPDELKAMVDAVRKTETCLGDETKTVLNVETETPSGRQCLHASKDMAEGELLSEENTRYLRPIGEDMGIEPKNHDTIMGKAVLRDVTRGETVDWADVKTEKPD
jgi:N-acetylneuraminate synthase